MLVEGLYPPACVLELVEDTRIFEEQKKRKEIDLNTRTHIHNPNPAAVSLKINK